MAAMGIKLFAVAVMAIVGTASAATYSVGEPAGVWDLNTNYGDWVSNKKFHPGDQIVFKYPPSAHNVVEVSKADYDSCSTASPIGAMTMTTGNDLVSLSATGTRYFICGFQGHCTTTGTGKMKVQIEVVPGSSPTSPAPAGGAPGAGSSPPPPSPSAATSVGAATGFGIAVMLAGLMA